MVTTTRRHFLTALATTSGEASTRVFSAEPRQTSSAQFHEAARDLPIRALIARDVDGLMMAGRCISGDFIAHASYRVTGNATAMGEAAGATAAVATKNKTAPHDVPWSEVQPVIAKVREQA
jgi:hypothetical protein